MAVLPGRTGDDSPPGAGTTLEVTLPFNDLTERGLPPEGAGLPDDASRGLSDDASRGLSDDASRGLSDEWRA